jgi:hypothetical protein
VSNIVVHFRDGTQAEHKHEGRAGGSYTKTLRYEGGFAIIQDEWGAETAYPESTIAKVETAPTRW